MKVSDLIQNRQIGALGKIAGTQKTDNKDSSGKSVNFGDTVKEFLNAVNEGKMDAGQKVEDVIQGNSENLAGAMVALEESSLSFQLMLEIRNKLIQS